VVAAGIAAASLFDLSGRGVKLLGVVPQGLPPFGLSGVSWKDATELLPLAMACFLLGAVETAAIGRTFARAHGYRFDANQEFLALAGSNLAVGLGSGYPVGAGMSQSLVNESSGARTPVSGLAAASIILVITLFFSGVLRNLPQPVLAAIILVAVSGLIKIDVLKRTWRFHRAEFAVSMVALVGVLHAGLLQGVLIGAAISLIMLLKFASHPPLTELGRVAGGAYFADRQRHPENLQEPGVFVFRVSGAILYFNTEVVTDGFHGMLAARGPDVRLVVFFMGNVPFVDLAGAEMLVELQKGLRERGIELRLSEVHGRIRLALRRAGWEQAVGAVEGHRTVDELIKGWRETSRTQG
jgi:MFS superfamily sulfate permease-like transporter